MPEMRFRIRWPDGQRESCYSPSLVVKEHLTVGDCYDTADFLERCRTALTIASARVEARYGRPCSLALGQLAGIERRSRTFASGGGKICVEAFED
jgi:uncharacterized repeat protein (TIGR04042 family)